MEEQKVENMTIEEKVETMDDFKDELEASYRRLRVGDVVEGTVIEVSEKGVTLDLNYFAPGKIDVEEISGDPSYNIVENIHVGDTLSGTVIETDDGSGNVVLSLKEATEKKAWEKLREMMENNTVIHGKIGGIVNAGAIMYVEGIRGFIPASKLDMTFVEDTVEYLNKEVSARIITVDEEHKRLVLSVKDVLLEEAIKEKNEKINCIAVGSVVEGTVEKLMDYGAFVNIGDGISGLVHISQISNRKIKHPKVVLTVGEKVKVKIIKIENNKISLSIKEADEVINKDVDEEVFDYKEEGEAATSLGSLLSGFKL